MSVLCVKQVSEQKLFTGNHPIFHQVSPGLNAIKLRFLTLKEFMQAKTRADSTEHLLVVCFPLAPCADHTQPICNHWQTWKLLKTDLQKKAQTTGWGISGRGINTRLIIHILNSIRVATCIHSHLGNTGPNSPSSGPCSIIMERKKQSRADVLNCIVPHTVASPPAAFQYPTQHTPYRSSAYTPSLRKILRKKIVCACSVQT